MCVSYNLISKYCKNQFIRKLPANAVPVTAAGMKITFLKKRFDSLFQ